MLRPKITVLDPLLINKIITEAMGLLMNPGVQVHNQDALNLLADAGARVSFSSQIAAIPENVVRWALATAPVEFYLFDLKGEPAVHYGGDDVQFDPGSAGIAILDSQTKKHRHPVTADFVKFVKLVETLPQLDAQSTAMVCSDVAEGVGDLYRLYVALNYMRKPIITGAFRKNTWWTMKEMLVAVAGSEQALVEKPIAVFDVCPSPPLLWSELTCQNLIDCARARIPAEIVSMPLAGATAPVTLAATVVQHTAETLSGLTIHQLANSGAPLVWGGSPSAFDMRHGTTPMGAAATWLIDVAYVQVGKNLGLPTQVYMGMSDSKLVDAQCGLESMGGTLTAVLASPNMVSGAGMLDFETCLSYEKLVIDNEIIGLARRVLDGVQVRDDPIALDMMRRMGHRGDYLSLKHTKKWFKKEQYIPSAVIDRSSLDGWLQAGSKSIFDRASERVDELLGQYESSPLSDDLRSELREIATFAAQQFGMESLPPLPDE